MFGAATVTNSLAVVTGTFAGRYGGPGPTAQVRNSTLVGESGSTGFRKDAGGTVELLNTVVSAGTDIQVNGGAVAARHSRFATVAGGTVTDQGGNIAAGPQFVDPTTGDYRLQADSPMVDAGETHDLLGPLDLGGLPRVSGAQPDIGAFEFQHPAPPPASGTASQSPEQPAPTSPAGTPTATAPADSLAPIVSHARLAPRRFPAGSRTARLQFTLSEPATISVAVAREQPGRRSGRRCLKPSRRLRRARRCTRLVGAGKLKIDGTAGANSVPFPGRGLKAGAYRLTIVPTDAAGNRGTPAAARFAIVQPRPKR
jgi:hypothetical protein